MLARVDEALKQAAISGQVRPGVDIRVLGLSYQGLYSNVLPMSHAGMPRDEARRTVAESLAQLRNGVARAGD